MPGSTPNGVPCMRSLFLISTTDIGTDALLELACHEGEAAGPLYLPFAATVREAMARCRSTARRGQPAQETQPLYALRGAGTITAACRQLAQPRAPHQRRRNVSSQRGVLAVWPV